MTVSRPFQWLIACSLIALQSVAGGAEPTARGTAGRQFNLSNQNMPPGRAAYFQSMQQPPGSLASSRIRVGLPSTGVVSLPGASAAPGVATPCDLQLRVGWVYRLRLAEMPEFPGVELFPTVEVLDSLRPPAGLEHKFPVPVAFTERDIRQALSGQLVTRVVYVEQPQLALAEPRSPEHFIGRDRDVLAEADLHGRPLLIVRLGSRILTPAAQASGGGIPAAPPVPQPMPVERGE